MTLVQPKKHQKLAKRGRPRKTVKVSCKIPINREIDKSKRATNESVYDNNEVKNWVMQRAKDVEANLPPKFPSMIKCMLPSHVAGGFWLGLPMKFCDDHMPIQDTMIDLEDENGVTFQAKYLAGKVGLSGGWRGFSIAHNLVQGDVLIFQLVRPNKFKIYIVRVNGSEEVDVSHAVLQSEAWPKEASPDQSENASVTTEKIEHLESEPVLMCDPELDNQKNDAKDSYTDIGLTSEHSENESQDVGLDLLDGIGLSESAVNFKEVKCYEDFDILNKRFELPKKLQFKYYKLCCSKRSFLHEHLLEGLNLKLAAGVIAETIDIADAIRASKLTTRLNSFIAWKKKLDALKKLGMEVDFLIARTDQLIDLLVNSRRYKALTNRKVALEERIRSLEMQLLEMKKETNRVDFEIQELEAEGGNHELMFRGAVEAPW
ncbi:B3 domain-containing protein Os01g0234100-like [Mercurialis annua]|uniref:B3 domain-containing protein Os01g0234100-like n=1 Tax=Mercurialis annua TaxID=3986 RepID=UPI00215F9488|nr:B3 domain-containing protein Os01g0234100-like [Mercurialis annua]